MGLTARWGMPAWTGPGSPQTPVRIPSREEVNHMTDINETPAETEAEEAQAEAQAEETAEADDSASDSPE